MNLIRKILYPFIPIYALVIHVRNWLFDKNIFKADKVSAKVISIGNLTVGGSGKTPAVIYLLNLLKKEGKKVGVLSRGYGRKTNGYLLVSDGEKILAPVDDCGDEIYLTVSECLVPGAVSENRFEGAKKFINDTKIDTIVLDDAFQHRWIKRDIDLVICEQKFLIDKSNLMRTLLPAGNMREPFSSLSRADAVIINRKFSDAAKIPADLEKYFDKKKIFHAKYKTINFVDVIKNTDYAVEEFTGQKSLLVSGIANPYSFINVLSQSKVDTQNRMIFRDHKNYSIKEIEEIRKKFYSTNSHSVLTTHKDAVKLSRYSKELDDIDIFYLKIELEVEEKEEFNEFILSKLN